MSKYYKLSCLAQPVPWGRISPAASHRPVLSGRISKWYYTHQTLKIWVLPKLLSLELLFWMLFNTRWTSKSWWQAWPTWWGTSAHGSTTATRALLMPSLKSESFIFSPFFSMCILCICFSKMRQRCQETFGENENVLKISLQIRRTRWSDKDVSCKTQCSGGRHQAMLSTRWGRLPRSSFFLIIVNNNNINVNNNNIMPSACWEKMINRQRRH